RGSSRVSAPSRRPSSRTGRAVRSLPGPAVQPFGSSARFETLRPHVHDRDREGRGRHHAGCEAPPLPEARRPRRRRPSPQPPVVRGRTPGLPRPPLAQAQPAPLRTRPPPGPARPAQSDLLRPLRLIARHPCWASAPALDREREPINSSELFITSASELAEPNRPPPALQPHTAPAVTAERLLHEINSRLTPSPGLALAQGRSCRLSRLPTRCPHPPPSTYGS